MKEVAWFKDAALRLERMKTVHLDPDLISEQLNEQKVVNNEQYITFVPSEICFKCAM